MLRGQPTSDFVPFAIACLGIAALAAMDAILKSLSIAIGVYNTMFWRTLVGVVLTAPLYVAQARRIPSRHAMLLHLGRGVTGAVSTLLFIWGLVYTPLAQAIALSFIAPLIALGLAALFLKERISARAIGGSVAAFAGVLVILAGQSEAGGKAGTFEGAIAILTAAVLYAVNIVISRRQSLAAGPVEVAFTFNLISVGLYSLGAPWLAQLPDARYWPAIVLASVAATGAIMLLAWAYARAEAQQLVAVEYTAFIWAVLLGWWAFGETVLPTTWLGAAMIVAGCLWAARQQPRPRRAIIEPGSTA